MRFPNVLKEHDVFETQDASVTRVQLEPALPCGMQSCHHLATSGLAAPDAKHSGLWELVPICDSCVTKLKTLELLVSQQ